MDKKKNKYKKNKNDNKQNNNNKEDKDEEEYDILESVGLKSIYYNDQIQRYFSKYYINKGQPNEQYIFIHSNGIIMCGIGSNNEILKKNIKEIIALKQLAKITGRSKHGAHILCANENIIQIKTDDDKEENNKEIDVTLDKNLQSFMKRQDKWLQKRALVIEGIKEKKNNKDVEECYFRPIMVKI